MSRKKIHEVKPREQVGATTNARYDYQYRQAAKACLDLLQDYGADCVFVRAGPGIEIAADNRRSGRVLRAQELRKRGRLAFAAGSIVEMNADDPCRGERLADSRVECRHHRDAALVQIGGTAELARLERDR